VFCFLFFLTCLIGATKTVFTRIKREIFKLLPVVILVA